MDDPAHLCLVTTILAWPGVQGQENVAGLQGAIQRTFRLGSTVMSGSWSASLASCCCSVADAQIWAGSAPQSGSLWPNEHPERRWQRHTSRVRTDLRSLSHFLLLQVHLNPTLGCRPTVLKEGLQPTFLRGPI